MAEGDAPSSSLARLRERVEGTVKINLSKTSRSRRIASLQELRRSVAEAKRAEYFKRLNSAFCEERGAPGEAASLEAEQEEPRVCNEEEEESLEPDAPTNAVLGRFDALCPRKPPGRSRESFRDIAGVLVNHEFLVATHMGIREEAAALKRSLLFVRPDGRRVLVVVNNFWATAYCRLGTKRHSFRVPFTKGPTVLDCVVKDYGNMGDRGEEELQYFVLDVLLYNGCLLAPSDTECRTFFLKSRLEEAAAETCRPSFVMVEYQECTPEAMRDAYYRCVLCGGQSLLAGRATYRTKGTPSYLSTERRATWGATTPTGSAGGTRTRPCTSRSAATAWRRREWSTTTPIGSSGRWMTWWWGRFRTGSTPPGTGSRRKLWAVRRDGAAGS
ncbi:snurportin1, putative [Babesia caballi]|uniref:Snurportin-1 n=1 Tax=Babesia caballi TaxID=5871 RepID=A0AAV4LRI6_BABCB|nr:snurportin1, putative [Babesia caballi]